MALSDCCDRVYIGMNGLLTKIVHIFLVSSINCDYFDINFLLIRFSILLFTKPIQWENDTDR